MDLCLTQSSVDGKRNAERAKRSEFISLRLQGRLPLAIMNRQLVVMRQDTTVVFMAQGKEHSLPRQ